MEGGDPARWNPAEPGTGALHKIQKFKDGSNAAVSRHVACLFCCWRACFSVMKHKHDGHPLKLSCSSAISTKKSSPSASMPLRRFSNGGRQRGRLPEPKLESSCVHIPRTSTRTNLQIVRFRSRPTGWDFLWAVNQNHSKSQFSSGQAKQSLNCVFTTRMVAKTVVSQWNSAIERNTFLCLEPFCFRSMPCWRRIANQSESQTALHLRELEARGKQPPTNGSWGIWRSQNPKNSVPPVNGTQSSHSNRL